jgi:anti-anti-sigma regulatory factor
VLDLGGVPLIDSTAVAMLKAFVAKANAQGIDVILAAATPAVRRVFGRFGVAPPAVHFSESVDTAIARAEQKRKRLSL